MGKYYAVEVYVHVYTKNEGQLKLDPRTVESRGAGGPH
jgi:hypothetical protein